MGVQKVKPEGSHLAGKYRQQAQDDSLSSEQREAYGLLAEAEAALENEDEKTALVSAEQALQLCRGSGYEELAADAARCVVQALIEDGQREEAQRVAERDLEDFRNSGSQRGEAMMQLCLATMVSDNPTAVRYAVTCGTLFHRLGDKRLECAALIALCEAHIMKQGGDPGEQGRIATAAAAMARDLAREAGARKCEAEALHAMALSHIVMGSWEDSFRLADEALDIYLEIKDRRGEAYELITMAEWCVATEDLKQAVIHAEDALAIYQELGSEREIYAVQIIFNIAMSCGDFQAARKAATKGLKRFHHQGIPSSAVIMMVMLISVSCKEAEVEYASTQSKEKYKDALEVTQKALHMVRYLGRKDNEARLLVVLSALCLKLDRLDGAVLAGKEALRLVKENGDTAWKTSAKYSAATGRGLSTSNMGDVLHTLSQAHMRKGEHEEALELAQSLRLYFKENKNTRGEAAALMTLNSVYLKLGMKKEAVKVAMLAQQLFNEAGDPGGEAFALRFLMENEWENGDHAASIRLGERASALFRENEDPRSEANILYSIAVNAIQLAVQAGARVDDGFGGRQSSRSRPAIDALVKAQKAAEKAVRIAKELMEEDSTGHQLLASSMAVLAQVHMLDAKPGSALECSDEAVILFREEGDYHSEGTALLLSADALRVIGQYEEAREAAEEALALCVKYKDEAGVTTARDLIEYLKAAPGQPEAEPDFTDPVDGGMEEEGDPSRPPPPGHPVPRRPPDRGHTEDYPSIIIGRPFEGPLPSNETLRLRRERGPPLNKVSQGGFDATKVRKRILEIAARSLDTEEELLQLDTPLMEVGMSSNAAIVFRDELQEEIPGVVLPVTLVFDYPTVAAMMRLILQQGRTPPKSVKR